jgi:TfoX/Sxy family transcriptional regulator of competence genes
MELTDIEKLMNENKEMKQRIIDLEEHLKKYTNSSGHRKYYEKNKEKVMKTANIYLKKLAEENPDKLKEYRRRAYLNRKEKNKIQENRGNLLVPP